MIRLRIKDKSYIYDVFHIVKAFFPNETVEQEIDEEQGMFLELEVCVQERICRICAEIKELDAYETKKEKKQYLDRKIYRALAEYSGKTLAWGILTGIRPTKIAMKMLEEQMEEEEIQRTLMEQYLMSEEKARLGIEIAKREKAQLEQLDYEDGYSLYVGIPFCPTTCAYCSFTSYPIEAWKTRVEEYLDALCKEISYVGDISKEKKLNTIYIGGGTPTTLEADQLDRLLTHLEETFSYEEIKEITVEAGRPDSITREKLEVLKRHKIPRISINPQTMQQKTLDLIGRRHTVEDILRVYGMARELEFENINMDLIAGLPGETVEDVKDTLRQIEELSPDSITVHSLAVKRASRLAQMPELKEAALQEERGRQMEAMIDLTAESAARMGMKPYYLYRQKNIAGNFENVGYAKVDKAGIYNILIMEEKQSIVAVGAGASTKAVFSAAEDQLKNGQPGKEVKLEKRIERVENVKDVGQYIARIDEMIERKGELLWH